MTGAGEPGQPGAALASAARRRRRRALVRRSQEVARFVGEPPAIPPAVADRPRRPPTNSRQRRVRFRDEALPDRMVFRSRSRRSGRGPTPGFRPACRDDERHARLLKKPSSVLHARATRPQALPTGLEPIAATRHIPRADSTAGPALPPGTCRGPNRASSKRFRGRLEKRRTGSMRCRRFPDPSSELDFDVFDCTPASSERLGNEQLARAVNERA